MQPTYWKIEHFKFRRIRLLNLTRSIAEVAERLIRIAEIIQFSVIVNLFIETFMESADTGTLSEY